MRFKSSESKSSIYLKWINFKQEMYDNAVSLSLNYKRKKNKQWMVYL